MPDYFLEYLVTQVGNKSVVVKSGEEVLLMHIKYQRTFFTSCVITGQAHVSVTGLILIPCPTLPVRILPD